MQIILNIPKEFEDHYEKDRFKDSLERIKADVESLNFEGLSGKYELETLEMLITALKTAVPTSTYDKLYLNSIYGKSALYADTDNGFMTKRMTREKALKVWHDSVGFNEVECSYKLQEAISPAFRELEKEPCEDCVSRQVVLEFIEKQIDHSLWAFEKLVKGIKALPSVPPKPMTDILDRIKAEIEQGYCKITDDYDKGRNMGLHIAMQIIDKYKAESEGKE